MTINQQLIKNHITFYRQSKLQISNLSIFTVRENSLIIVLSIIVSVPFQDGKGSQFLSRLRFIDKYISQIMNFFKSNGFIGVEGKLSI